MAPVPETTTGAARIPLTGKFSVLILALSIESIPHATAEMWQGALPLLYETGTAS